MDFQDIPSQPRVIPWKLILIIGGGVVIAAGIIWGVVVYTHRSSNVSSPNNSRGPQTPITSKSSMPSSVDQCVDYPNPEGCKTFFAKQEAATKKDVKVCASLPSVSKDDCIWGVANAANDESICLQLSNKDDVRLCTNHILIAKAVAASDDAMCDKMADDAGKKNCHASVLATVTIANCEARKQDPAYCTFLRTVDSAVKASDRDLCNVLTDEKNLARCRARVAFDDPDQDGLSTEQEIKTYHTDPRKADTDGDGYSDGDEVRTGHDPLKK